MTLKATSKNNSSIQLNTDLMVEFCRDKDGIKIINRHQGGHQGCSNLFWMTGFSMVIAFLCGQLVFQPTLSLVCFAVPFLSAWTFACCSLAWQFLGREEFVLTLDHAEIKRYCIFKIAHKTVATREITLFRQRDYAPALARHHKNMIAIDIETLGNPIRCLHNLNKFDANFVGNSLNEFLREDCAMQWTNRAEPKNRGKAFVSLPTHSNRFRFDYGFTAVNFSRRGSIDWTRIGNLACFSGFWNGIVFMFILNQMGWIATEFQRSWFDWWLCTLFLVPFTIFGLCALAELISTMARPLFLTQWSIDKPMISKRISLLGLTLRNTTTDLQTKSRFRIRRMQRSEFLLFGSQTDRPALRKVVLLNSDEEEYCTISHLTDAEATEIASQLEFYCRGWVSM